MGWVFWFSTLHREDFSGYSSFIIISLFYYFIIIITLLLLLHLLLLLLHYYFIYFIINISLFFYLILIFSLHCQLLLLISGYYTTCNIKITYQCKIIIVPEEGWFGQPKYSTHKKDPSTLCRLLLLFSSFYMWSRLDHYIDPTYTSGIIVPVACLNVLLQFPSPQEPAFDLICVNC